MLRPSRNIIAEKVVITSLNAADATYSEPLRLEQFWHRRPNVPMHQRTDADSGLAIYAVGTARKTGLTLTV